RMAGAAPRSSGPRRGARQATAGGLGAVPARAAAKASAEPSGDGGAETATATATADSGDQEDSATSRTAHDPGEGMAYTVLPEVISPEMLERGFRLEEIGRAHV